MLVRMMSVTVGLTFGFKGNCCHRSCLKMWNLQWFVFKDWAVTVKQYTKRKKITFSLHKKLEERKKTEKGKIIKTPKLWILQYPLYNLSFHWTIKLLPDGNGLQVKLGDFRIVRFQSLQPYKSEVSKLYLVTKPITLSLWHHQLLYI